MTPALYMQAIVNRDMPDVGLYRGDVGLYIEFLEHPESGEDGAIIEVSTLDGDSRLVTVPISAIEAPRADLVWAARETDPKWFKEYDTGG